MLPFHLDSLGTDLALSEWDGLTADAAFARLTEPTATTSQVPTGYRITPLDASAMLGPAKAQAIAAALRQAYPDIAESLMGSGIDPTNASAGGFFTGLVQASVLTPEDVAAVMARCVRTVTTTTPPLFLSRFGRAVWPEQAGNYPTGVPGFPNRILRAEFDAAWAQAGRN